MAEYGSNYDYGDSPYYKDDDYASVEVITEYEETIVDLLIDQFRRQYGLDEVIT
jgi:hypothetical protein